MKWTYRLLLFVFAMQFIWAQGDYKKGVSYYQQQQYQKAIEEFKPIVEKQPDYEFGHRMLGFCYLQLGQYDQAIGSLQEAIRLDPKEFDSYRALALAYFNAQRFEEVGPTLDKAAALSNAPKAKYEIARMRGATAFNLGHYREAATALEQALSIQRGNADDVLQLGLAYVQLDQYDKAEEYLKQAVALRPDNEAAKQALARLQFRKAAALIENKQYDEAGRLLRGFLEENPEDGEGWFNLGLAYLFGNNLEASEEAFLRSLKLAPNNSDAHNRLGYIYEKTKRYKEALESYQAAYALDAKPEYQESIERVKKRLSQGD